MGTAQSLEQSYAEQCGDGQESEACQVLKQAMLLKLSAGSVPDSSTGNAAAEPINSRGESGALSPWEFWSDLAGTSWKTGDGRVFSYNWKQAGQVLESHVYASGKKSTNTLSLNEDGTALVLAISGGDENHLRAIAEGASEQITSSGGKAVYRRMGDKIVVENFMFDGSEWKLSTRQERMLIASEEVAAAVQAALISDETIAERWGVYAQLAGTGWYSETQSGDVTMTGYVWKTRGESLDVFSRVLGLTDGWQRLGSITWDERSDSFRYDWKSLVPMAGEGDATFNTSFVKEAENTFVYTNSDGSRSTSVIQLAGETLTSFSETFSAEGKQIGEKATHVERRLQPEDPRRLIARFNQRLKSDQKQAQAESEPSGGLFRALLGAGVGLASAAAHDLDATQTLGAMMKGVQVTNPDSAVANALGAQGEQLLKGGGSASTLSGVISGAGSYATKPNLATGACSGFTESNYRQKAFQGGGDTQLYTMCGQAFELYTMYKRAIAQGYSEADANGTYEAHRQAAATASGYLSSHGVN